MFLGIATALAIGVSALVCVETGAFGGLNWIWLLPACFFGVLAVAGGLLYVLLRIMAAAVDMEKPQERDSRFYRFVIGQTAGALIPLLNIQIRKKGMEQLPRDGRFLLVCNHISELDPIFLLYCFSKSTLAFISKRENDERPLVGPMLHKLLCQPINRENDREALKTILKCIEIIKEDKASIGVFPEGYVSLDAKLRPLKGGVFKIAKRAGVPVVVCTVRNTQEVFKNAVRFRPTQVPVHLAGVIDVQTVEALTAVELAEQAHELMARDLGPELVYSGPAEDAWRGTAKELLMKEKENP